MTTFERVRQIPEPKRYLYRYRAPAGHHIQRYLGRAEVAEYMGLASVDSLSGVALPPHDAIITGRRGWLPETIDTWLASRPGKGRRGQRMGNCRDGSHHTQSTPK